MVLVDPSFGGQSMGPGAKKPHEWSPINRMLSQKKGGKPKASAPLGHSLSGGLPPRPAQTPPAGPRTTTATQSITWEVLATEASASERSRADALQKELRQLKAQLKDLESNAAASGAQQLSEALQRAEAAEAEAAELRCAEAASRAALDAAWGAEGAVRSTLDQARAQFEEERQRHEEERSRWRLERGDLEAELKRTAGLSQELDATKGALGELRRAHAALQEEKNALAAEKDQLLERLEVEQAEMMARVEKLEKRGRR